MKVEARLRAFTAFARRRSFSAAAEELRVSQPAVSKHIADLESDLGVRLIERLPRGGKLTIAGELLASHALRAEAILVQARRVIAAFGEFGQDSLALMASGVPGTYLLPSVIATFRDMYPGMRVCLELGTSAEVAEAVRGHRVELGFVGGLETAPEIQAEPFMKDQIIVVGPPDLAKRRMSPEQLQLQTWFFRENGSATRAIVESALLGSGIALRRLVELPSWEAIKLEVQRGHGIAALSRVAVAHEIKSGSLVRLPVSIPRLERNFSIIRTRDAALTPAAQRFVLLLRACCGQGTPRNVVE